MKCLIYSDVHWNSTSSLVRGRGEKYSTRLELLIKGVNWVNNLATEHNCEVIFNLGDFFDKSVLDDEQITAITEISWANIPQYFLCGNHESSRANLEFNTLNVLRGPNRVVITDPTELTINGVDFSFLPYIPENLKKPLTEYFTKKNTILLSHNDIIGYKYETVESTKGFELLSSGDMFRLILNGHLHNTEKLAKRIVNVGSFSAANFNNDSFKYSYGAWILDTDTLELEFIENPYSLNFYKININKESDFRVLETLKTNSVVSIKCVGTLLEQAKEKLSGVENIIESKVLALSTAETTGETAEEEAVEFNQDHRQKFYDYCKVKIQGDPKIIEEELTKVCFG